MPDIGNIVVLCDENDNEVEFEVVHKRSSFSTSSVSEWFR